MAAIIRVVCLLALSEVAAFAAMEDASSLFQTTPTQGESGDPIHDRRIGERARQERQRIALKSRHDGQRAGEEARRLAEKPASVEAEIVTERHRVAQIAQGEAEAARRARRLAVKHSRVAARASAGKLAQERQEHISEQLRQQEEAEQQHRLDHAAALRTAEEAAREAKSSEQEVKKLHAEVLKREHDLANAKAANALKLARRHEGEQLMSRLLEEAQAKLEQNAHGGFGDEVIDNSDGMFQVALKQDAAEFEGVAVQSKRVLADSMAYFVLDAKAAVDWFLAEVAKFTKEDDLQPLMANFINVIENKFSKERANIVKRVQQVQALMPATLSSYLSDPLRMVEDAPTSFGINTAELEWAPNTKACNIRHDALEKMSSVFKQYSEAQKWLDTAATQAFQMKNGAHARMLSDMVAAGYVVTIGMGEVADMLMKTALPTMAKHLHCKEEKKGRHWKPVVAAIELAGAAGLMSVSAIEHAKAMAASSA